MRAVKLPEDVQELATTGVEQVLQDRTKEEALRVVVQCSLQKGASSRIGSSGCIVMEERLDGLVVWRNTRR